LEKRYYRIEAGRISATASVTAPKLPLKWLSPRFRPSFRYGRKWNLVSACRRRSTILLSGPSLKWLRLCNMTAVSSSVSGYTLNMLQLIFLSLLNRPRRIRTVVVYLLQFVEV